MLPSIDRAVYDFIEWSSFSLMRDDPMSRRCRLRCSVGEESCSRKHADIRQYFPVSSGPARKGWPAPLAGGLAERNWPFDRMPRLFAALGLARGDSRQAKSRSRLCRQIERSDDISVIFCNQIEQPETIVSQRRSAVGIADDARQTLHIGLKARLTL